MGDNKQGGNTWGGESRDKGIRLVVAVVDDAVAQLLHEAADCGSVSDWGDGRRVHEPGRPGIARVLTTRIYQDLLGFASDLMIFDPDVAEGEAWDVLCDYFSGCGAAGERLLLLRPLELPPSVSAASVTVANAPRHLTVDFLREQIMRGEASSKGICANSAGDELGRVTSPTEPEATLMLQIDHYDSFAPSSSRTVLVRRDAGGGCHVAETSSGPWITLPDRCTNTVNDWIDLLASAGLTRLLDEYSDKCRKEQWTAHPDQITIGLIVGGESQLHWRGDCGCNFAMAHLSPGIIADYLATMRAMADGKSPAPLPAVYRGDLSRIRYAPEGPSPRAAMVSLVHRAHLAVWSEHQHDWWTLLDVASSRDNLESFLESLASGGVNWRDGLSEQEVLDAERVLRSQRVTE